MKKILVIGMDEVITNVIIRLLHGMEGYSGVATNSINEMLASLREQKYDILLIGAGFDEEQENTIRQKALEIQKGIKIIQHFGGGSGLLKAELEQLNN